MKKIIFSLCVLLCISVHLKAQYKWSKYEEIKIKADASKAGISSMKLSEEEAMIFADCVFQKASNKYPNIKSMPEEFVKNIAYQCGLTMRIAWSKALENKMIDIILSAKEMKIFAVEYRKQFAECIVNGIKSKFPDGIKASEAESLAKMYGSQIGRECYQEIINNIK